MPQNGVHAIAGIAARKWMPQKEWLVLGVILGNMLPDLDNLAVAYATLTKVDLHGLHRTFTHSILTIVAIIVLFSLIAAITKNRKWNNCGRGLGIGIFMHILLDLILWFDGVELFWPIRYELNFWRWFTVPDWLSIILDAGEFLAFGFYFLLLSALARRESSNAADQRLSKTWAYVEFALFILFTLLFFTVGPEGLPYTIFGALYLVSTIVAIIMTIQMRKTIEPF